MCDLRPGAKSPRNVTGRSKIPSTCRENSAKRYWSQQDTLDLAQNPRKTLQVAAKHPRPVAISPRNVTGRSRIPSTCHEIPAKRYRSQQNTLDLSRNPRKTLQVATEYLQPVTKSPRNVTGRSKIPSTWRNIPAKRYRSQQDTFDLSRNRPETLQVATEYLRPGAISPQNVTGRDKKSFPLTYFRLRQVPYPTYAEPLLSQLPFHHSVSLCHRCTWQANSCLCRGYVRLPKHSTVETF